jgi:hypothetical protein
MTVTIVAVRFVERLVDMALFTGFWHNFFLVVGGFSCVWFVWALYKDFIKKDNKYKVPTNKLVSRPKHYKTYHLNDARISRANLITYMKTGLKVLNEGGYKLCKIDTRKYMTTHMGNSNLKGLTTKEALRSLDEKENE